MGARADSGFMIPEYAGASRKPLSESRRNAGQEHDAPTWGSGFGGKRHENARRFRAR